MISTLKGYIHIRNTGFYIMLQSELYLAFLNNTEKKKTYNFSLLHGDQGVKQYKRFHTIFIHRHKYNFFSLILYK